MQNVSYSFCQDVFVLAHALAPLVRKIWACAEKIDISKLDKVNNFILQASYGLSLFRENPLPRS